MNREIAISVQAGDALCHDCDVLILKYAQSLYGADAQAVARLESEDRDLTDQLPGPGLTRLVSSGGAIAADNVLFVGTPPLRDFDYLAIREFAYRALESLTQVAANVRHIALTLHGPGFGLDEAESFRAELSGLLDALEVKHLPVGLQQIDFVEMNDGRAARLRQLLKGILPSGSAGVGASRSTTAIQAEARSALADAGQASGAKPHVFVAMPFADEFNDRFHYGIQRATNVAGFLCERADLSTFTGDIVEYVRRRIDTAKYLIADLSGANPNVYLEVGYAWGRRVPTILLVTDEKDLQFDTRGQRCLVYKNSIRQLEELLNKELSALTT